MVQRLLIEDDTFDHLIDMIEDSYEAYHKTTMDLAGQQNHPDFIDAQNHMRSARRLLKTLCDEHPLFTVKVKAGRAFDWDAFWMKVEKASEAEQEAKQETVSVADEA